MVTQLVPLPDHGGAAIVAAVAALPALPPHTGGDRYSLPALTAAWLTDYAPHTRKAYFRDLADFLAWCQREGLDPRVARATDLGRYRAALSQPASGSVPSPASVHRRLSALSSWYRYLVANSDGQVSTNPVSGVRRPRADRDASATVGLSAEEVRALLAAADARALAAADLPDVRRLAALRDRALVRMLADLGLRVGEALALDLPALAHNRGQRTVRYLGKGGKRRERPLSSQVAAALGDYLAARAAVAGVAVERLTGPLFATAGRGGRPGRLDEPAAFRLIRRLATAAGLPAAQRLSPHSLRHAFATNAREIGLPLEDVQDAMGHADTRTTRRYDRARHALERDPALRLGDLYAG